MTVGIDTMTVDGQEVRALSCTLESGGLFAVAGVVGSLAAQKTALDACLPSGGAFEVEWSWVAGKTATQKVLKASTASASTCVQGALGKTTSGVNGTCKAVLLLGEPVAAAAAATALK